MRESSKAESSTDKVRRETLFIVYYLGSSYLLSNDIIDFEGKKLYYYRKIEVEG